MRWGETVARAGGPHHCLRRRWNWSGRSTGGLKKSQHQPPGCPPGFRSSLRAGAHGAVFGRGPGADHRAVRASRRRYLDYLLCKVSPLYLDALQHYQQVLRQRNEWLRHPAGGLREVLDEQLTTWAEPIIDARRRLPDRAGPGNCRFYRELSGVEILSEQVRYRASVPDAPEPPTSPRTDGPERRLVARPRCPGRIGTTWTFAWAPKPCGPSAPAANLAAALRRWRLAEWRAAMGHDPIYLLDDCIVGARSTPPGLSVAAAHPADPGRDHWNARLVERHARSGGWRCSTSGGKLGRRRSGPGDVESLSGIFSQSMAVEPQSAFARWYRCFLAWQSVLGPEIAAQVQLARVVNGVAWVRTTSPVWAHQLTFLKPDILRRLAEKLGPKVITDLRVERGLARPPERATTVVEVHIGPARTRPPSSAAPRRPGCRACRLRSARPWRPTRLMQARMQAAAVASCLECGQLTDHADRACQTCQMATCEARHRSLLAALTATPWASHWDLQRTLPGHHGQRVWQAARSDAAQLVARRVRRGWLAPQALGAASQLAVVEAFKMYTMLRGDEAVGPGHAGHDGALCRESRAGPAYCFLRGREIRSARSPSIGRWNVFPREAYATQSTERARTEKNSTNNRPGEPGHR